MIFFCMRAIKQIDIERSDVVVIDRAKVPLDDVKLNVRRQNFLDV
jgi:hypothetical protein